MGFKIITAKEANLGSCARILLAEFNEQGMNWTPERAVKRLRELLNGSGPCFCLLLNKKIIGFAFCQIYTHSAGKHLFVEELAIDSSYQGKGFGTKTIRFIDKFAKKNKFQKIVLLANTKEKAAKLYKKLGFNPTNYKLFTKKV